MVKSQPPRKLAKAAASATAPDRLGHRVDEPTRPQIVPQQKLLQRRALPHDHRCQQVPFHHFVIHGQRPRKCGLEKAESKKAGLLPLRSEEPHVRTLVPEFLNGAIRSRSPEAEVMNVGRNVGLRDVRG